MFERYTEKARRTIFFARYEASQFGSSTIETEHLLLGLFREDREMMLRFLGEQTSNDFPEVEVPPEIAELQERIQSIVRRMENAIANHDFQVARACSDEERLERGNLRELCEKYKLTDTSAGLIPEEGRMGEIRRRIEALTQRRSKISTSVDLPLSQGSKRSLARAAEEMERLNHRHIGTEHLLLGLLREEGSVAEQVLRESGVRLNGVRQEVAARPSSEVGPSRPGVSFGPRGPHWGGRMGSMGALQGSLRVAFLARQEAAKRQGLCIETTDLLLALLHEKEIRDRFSGLGESLTSHLKPPAPPHGERVAAADLAFSEECKLAFGYTAEEAAHLGQRTGPEHLLLGILRVENCAAAEILRACGLTASGIRATLSSPPPSSSDPEQGRNYV